MRKAYEIRPQNAADGATGPYGRNFGAGIESDMDQRRADSAQQIKNKIIEMPQPIFNVVSEDPEKPHIPNDMHPPCVHENGREKRHQGIAPKSAVIQIIVREPPRGQTVFNYEVVNSRSQGNLIDPDKTVDDDYEKGHDGHGA